MQWEVSNRTYDKLVNTPDAKGRSLQIIKVPCPPPLFRTYKEAAGVAVCCSFPLSITPVEKGLVRFRRLPTL